MVRLLIFLAALALVAGGLTWLANNPGVVDLTWRGEQYEVSLLFALGAVLALGIAIAIVWGLPRWFRSARGRAGVRRVFRLCRAACSPSARATRAPPPSTLMTRTG
jgi:uncharacterized membrane-anchored protein